MHSFGEKTGIPIVFVLPVSRTLDASDVVKYDVNDGDDDDVEFGGVRGSNLFREKGGAILRNSASVEYIVKARGSFSSIKGGGGVVGC